MVSSVNISNHLSSRRKVINMQPAFGKSKPKELTEQEINHDIQTCRQKRDLVRYAKILNEQFASNEQDFNRGKYIQDYFGFVQSQIKQAFGTELSIELPEDEKTIWFNTVNPESFADIHETLKKYQDLALASSADAQGSRPCAFPQRIVIKCLKNNTPGEYISKTKSISLTPDLDRGHFNKDIKDHNRDITFEHELKHFFEDRLGKLFSKHTYLDILTPEEKQHYSIFDSFFKQYFDRNTIGPDDCLPMYGVRLARNSFEFSSGYENTSRTLVDLETNYNAFRIQLQKELGPEFAKKTYSIVCKLTDFMVDTKWQVSDLDYHCSTPAETRAEAAAIRAVGNPYSAYHLLPLTHGYEKQLARIGLSQPDTYTILNDVNPENKPGFDYLRERANKLYNTGLEKATETVKQEMKQKWEEFKKIDFGKEFVRRVSKKCLEHFTIPTK